MKIIKTTKDEIAIILNKEEIAALIKISGMPPEEKMGGGEDKLKHLNKNSRLFIEACKIKFGSDIISRKDPKLKDLLFKHKITGHTQIINTLESKGLAIVARTEKGIDSIQFI